MDITHFMIIESNNLIDATSLWCYKIFLFVKWQCDDIVNESPKTVPVLTIKMVLEDFYSQIWLQNKYVTLELSNWYET